MYVCGARSGSKPYLLLFFLERVCPCMYVHFHQQLDPHNIFRGCCGCGCTTGTGTRPHRPCPNIATFSQVRCIVHLHHMIIIWTRAQIHIILIASFCRCCISQSSAAFTNRGCGDDRCPGLAGHFIGSPCSSSSAQQYGRNHRW